MRIVKNGKFWCASFRGETFQAETIGAAMVGVLRGFI